MEPLQPLDLHFLGFDNEIGVYVVETTDGLALFDCGPSSTVEALRDGLRGHGLEVRDLRHLLLSHIHLDHAGAAGTLVEEHPGLTVWVSEIGAPHLVDPSKLESSARRLFPNFDTLWGPLRPVPEANIRIAAGSVVGWDAFPTPGHASHHVSYLREGVLLAGDACGVRILPSEFVQAVAPPPDIDVELWHRTVDEVERRAPDSLALIHFGVVHDVPDHLRRFRETLDLWSERVRSGMSEDEFVAAVIADTGEAAERYQAVFTFGMSYRGLKRYWDKREAA